MSGGGSLNGSPLASASNRRPFHARHRAWVLALPLASPSAVERDSDAFVDWLADCAGEFGSGERLAIFGLAGFAVCGEKRGFAERNPENPDNPANPDSDKARVFSDFPFPLEIRKNPISCNVQRKPNANFNNVIPVKTGTINQFPLRLCVFAPLRFLFFRAFADFPFPPKKCTLWANAIENRAFAGGSDNDRLGLGKHI